MPDRSSVLRLAYDEGVRTLADQARTLDQIRVRTAGLMTIGTVASAAMLPAILAARDHDKDALFWSGVITAAAVYAFALVSWAGISRPKYEWRFQMSPKVILDGYVNHPQPATFDETVEELASIMDDNINHNQTNLNSMNRALGNMTFAVVADIALWAAIAAKVG